MKNISLVARSLQKDTILKGETLLLRATHESLSLVSIVEGGKNEIYS